MRIEVDPEALIAAGQQTGAIGAQLAQLSDALGAALGGGISSGMDPAGMNFGLKYGHQAGEFTSAVADAANAFASVGMLLQATGYNYRNADAAATIGGAGPSGGLGAEPGKTLPAHVPAGPNGVTVPPPDKWYLIQPFLQVLPGIGFFSGAAMTWPSGDASIMGVTAAQWRNFATGFALIEPQMSGIKSVVGAQQIPEGGAMKTALESLGTAISSLAEVSNSVAQSITDFASGVQATQDAIRRILDRLSLDGLWDTVKGVFTGEADDVLREVAHDVSAVLNNFQQQVKGIVGLLDELTGMIGDAATAFQKWIRPILVENFGEGVGNRLADAVTLYTDIQAGAVTGLIGTVSGVVGMADPDTWKGMAEMALSVAKDPSTLPGVLANTGKEFVAWDKWSGDHPGRAAGEAAFNIGSLFVPGGALSKTGSVAKGLNLSRHVLEEGRLPKLGELGSWTRGAPNTIEAPHVPEFNPGSAGGVPPLRPEGIPGGAGPGAPGTGAAPSGPRPGEPSAPAARPSGSGAEGGAGPRALLDAGRGGGGPAAAPNGSPDAPTGTQAQQFPAAERETPPESSPSGGGAPLSSQANAPASPDHQTPSGSYDEQAPPHEAGTHGGELEGHERDRDMSGASDSTSEGHGGPEPHRQQSGDVGQEHSNADYDHPAQSPVYSHEASGDVHVGQAQEVAHELNVAYQEDLPTSDLVRRLSEFSTHYVAEEGHLPGNVDRVVLGKWEGQDGGYIGEARSNGGIYYDTGQETWDNLTVGLSEDQTSDLGWRVNEQFLRTQMENGVSRIEYILDTKYASLEEVVLKRHGSFSAMEIEFLTEVAPQYGYRRFGNSWVME